MRRRLALITGGCSGIGLSIARLLAENNDLALAYADNHERATAACEEIKICAPEARMCAFAGRLSGYEDCASLLARVSAEFGQGPDILVNSAGGISDELFLGSNFDQHLRIVQEHLVVTMALCHLVLRRMYKERFGRIVNIGSISGRYARRGQCSYAAAKAGIEGFSRTLALEAAHRGITVNVVSPGLIATALTKSFIERIEKRVDLTRMIPAGSVGKPDDVGALVAFLCSDQAAYITGSVYTVDGGRSLGDPHL